MTLRNGAGPGGRALLVAGLVCLTTGIAIIVARLHDPTPGVVIVAGAAVIAGFTLASSGVLALLSRPVWIEGTVRDARWTVAGVRRVGVIVLDAGEPDPLTLHLDPPVFRAIGVGDRLRVQHNSLNRAHVYAVEILHRAGA